MKRTTKKKNSISNPPTQQTATPFIVRIPHLQPKSTLSTESGKVVLVQGTGESSASNLPLQQKSFSVVKLADGQIILVPTTAVQQNENGISQIIKAASPPKPPSQAAPVSPQERRLRPIAPAPFASIQTSTELLNSLLAQQQQQLLLEQQSETNLRVEDVPSTTVSETVTVDTNGPKVEPPRPITQKTKNVRKTVPIPSPMDEKRIKIDPEEVIRTRICEAVLRSIIFKIEREQTQESMKKRLKNSAPSIPKPDHRKLVLTRLLNERVDTLRQEFIGNRLNRKTALVKEQVQTQRLKQQQLILKQQQQQQATTVKQEESSSENDQDAKKTDNLPPPPPVKKPRKSTGNETKKTPKPKTKR